MKELIIYSDGVNSVEFKCHCGTPLIMKKVVYNSHWYCPKCKIFLRITIVEKAPPKKVVSMDWEHNKKKGFFNRIKMKLKQNAKTKL